MDLKLKRDVVYRMANGDRATVIHLGKANKAQAPVTILWHLASGDDKTVTNYRTDGTHVGRDRTLDLVEEWREPAGVSDLSKPVKTLKRGWVSKFILPGVGVTFSCVYPTREIAVRQSAAHAKGYEQLGIVPAELIEREVGHDSV